MCTPLACSDYYGTSAPSTAIDRQRTPPPAGPAARRGGRPWAVPTFTMESIDEGGARLNLDSIATVTPQTFAVASPPDRSAGFGVDRPQRPGPVTRCTPAPYPSGLSRHWPYGALPLVSLVYRLISLAGPGLSGSATPSRLCQRCLPSSPASPSQTALSSCQAAATARREGLAPPSVLSASRRTATSWRRMKISTFLAAPLRASSPSQPNSLSVMRYSSRNSTAGDHATRAQDRRSRTSPHL